VIASLFVSQAPWLHHSSQLWCKAHLQLLDRTRPLVITARMKKVYKLPGWPSWQVLPRLWEPQFLFRSFAPWCLSSCVTFGCDRFSKQVSALKRASLSSLICIWRPEPKLMIQITIFLCFIGLIGVSCSTSNLCRLFATIRWPSFRKSCWIFYFQETKSWKKIFLTHNKHKRAK